MNHRFFPIRIFLLLAALLIGLGLSSAALLVGRGQAASANQAAEQSASAALAQPAAPYSESEIVAHLAAGRRLHVLVNSPDWPGGTFAAPDGDWQGGAGVINGAYTATRSYALRIAPVYVFRTSVQNGNGEDIAWGNGDIEGVLQDVLLDQLHHQVLNEAQLANGLSGARGVLILPPFTHGYETQVAAALGEAGLAAIGEFVHQGGTVYAQSNAAYLLEAAGVLPVGSLPLVRLDTPLSAPNDLGELEINAPDNLLAFNWKSTQLWVLQDPAITPPDGYEVVATYTNTLGGPQPAILTGEYGQGRVVMVAGHPTLSMSREQLSIFFNSLLWGMAERAELHGRAIQTYDPLPGLTVIPAYEANIPISVTLCADHLWQGITLTQVTLAERVAYGFDVDAASVQPPASAISVTAANGITMTTITWELGERAETPACFSYFAYTQQDALAAGMRTFSQGELNFTDGRRNVVSPHKDFTLSAKMPARLLGQHDKEGDRFYFIPEEGVILDEFVFLENKEDSRGYNLKLVRYIPLIVPIVGLEDQRRPLATNAGETVWMRNEFFLFENGDYLLPEGFSSPTQTLNIENWDGQTFVTMTTPGGYHIDPPQTRVQDGFFVAIPPTYTNAITVTADHQLLLPAARVEWDLGDFPGFWYEMPAVRFGIASRELFSRSVSFTGDPQVGTVVVDAKGGSVYTGLGADPTLDRDLLVKVVVAPPQAPVTGRLTYQDIWSRTHELELRAGFYDVFNYATCDCDGGLQERHQRLNVTFAIWADTDADGVGDKLLTDYDLERGNLPTRVTGDLDLLIKTRNLAEYGVGYDQNLIEGRIFRGLGFVIEPRGEDWFASYESPYSTLVSATVEGGYEVLTFRQDIPAGQVNTIRVHARVDATARQIEELLKLHDGVSFLYRQGFAGEAQFEIHDTHVQGVLGVRSDAAIDSRVLPAALSTYSDTFFTDYEISDPSDPRLAAKEVYLDSWGFDDAAATTYVGGREGRELFFSLLRLGDRTWVRVELNNNTGEEWSSVQVGLQPPAGITVTQLFTQSVPPPMWPDLPFLNLETIPDAAYGIYYFELQTDAAAAALLNQVVEIPVTIQAAGAPAGFAAPPARIAVRSAAGAPPYYASGISSNLAISEALHTAVTPLALRIMDRQQFNSLSQLVAQDQSSTPNTHLAADYFFNLTSTLPFTFTGGFLNYTLADQIIPWDIAGGGSPLYAVSLNAFTGTRATRYQVNNGAELFSLDSFGMSWNAHAAPDFIEARGASLQGVYVIEGITRTLTNEPVDVLYAYETNRVSIRFDITNAGTDVAANTVLTISLAADLNPVEYPASITAADGQLLWTVGSLAPGGRKQAIVTFEVFVNPANAAPARRSVIWGYLPALIRSDAGFVNIFSGQSIQAQISDRLALPYGSSGPLFYRGFLPLVANNYIGNIFPFQVGEAIPLRVPSETGEVFYQKTFAVSSSLPEGGHFYLSSQPDAIEPVLIDDAIAIVMDGSDLFTYNFSAASGHPAVVVEIPRTVMETAASQTVTIEYRDLYGVLVQASQIWLIWMP